MQQDSIKNPKIITKVSLVIYCLIMLACFIILITISSMQKDYSFVFGFLLCLLPGMFFIFSSMLLPSPALIKVGLAKKAIVWFVIIYVLKYAIIIGVPFIGIAFNNLFNKWVMLAITLIAPIQTIITKAIFANFISKNKQNITK